jgi:glycosyltransferase involved in cell wall biosynthesis
LRLCLLTTSFLPLVGGAEKSADMLACGLQARGYEVMVLAQHTGERPGALPYAVRHYRRPPAQHLWPESLAWPIWSAWRTWKFDVILAFDSYPLGYAATWVKHRLKVPVVISPRGGDVEPGFSALRKPRVARCLAEGYRRADRIVAISGWVRDRVIAMVPGTLPPIDVVYNGVELGDHEKLAAAARANPPALGVKPPYILHLGRVDENKQQATGIRAVHLLRDTFRARGITYVIVGDGRGMPEAKQLVADLGIGDLVAFLGTRDGVEKAWLYDHAACFVSASRSEGFGRVLIEAMAAGLPIVASDIPTHREVVATHQAGVLFETGSPENLAAKLVGMVDATPAVRAASRAAANHFTVKAMIDGYERACMACLPTRHA